MSSAPGPIPPGVEPIASSGAGAVFRPAGGAPSSELSALLRDGRVLNAEVLTGSTEGTMILAIGRHSVPAESELDLDPGARFQVLVEQNADGIVLRILAPPEGEDAILLRALRGVVGDERPLGELLGELLARLRGPGEALPELAPLLRALEGQAATPQGDPSALRTLLGSLGLGHEAALALLVGVRPSHEGFARLRNDLKALLLRAQGALEAAGGPPELHEAVTRALSGLEAEQLLNAAREKAGEPLILSFPFPDGERWATARLAVPSRRERNSGGADEREEPFRLTLGLELSQLGPVRADLALAPGMLSVRILVTSPELVRRIEPELANLRKRLGDGRRAVELAVRLGTGREATQGLEAFDIAFLRDHHIMNVAG
ncbi:MAG: flagellar hook-length control protein FliK [Planctomycetes bacterium]|nr:flagellar hook-length control protein FliK [Planctomycetota bacterium]